MCRKHYVQIVPNCFERLAVSIIGSRVFALANCFIEHRNVKLEDLSAILFFSAMNLPNFYITLPRH